MISPAVANDRPMFNICLSVRVTVAAKFVPVASPHLLPTGLIWMLGVTPPISVVVNVTVSAKTPDPVLFAGDDPFEYFVDDVLGEEVSDPPSDAGILRGSSSQRSINVAPDKVMPI